MGVLVEEVSPIISKLTMTMILIGLLEKGSCTNKELSKHIGVSSAQISPILRQMELFELVDIDKSSMDKREIIIKLTPLGKAQGWLAKASVKLIPGRDEDAEAVIKFFSEKFGGKKNEKNK